MSDDPNVVEIRTKRPYRTSAASKAAAKANGAKGLARAKITNHKPASGHKPGGPASGLPSRDQISAHVEAVAGRAPDAPRRTRQGMIEAAMAVLEAVIDDDSVPPVAKAFVADKLLDRLEGKAVARQINADATGLENWVLDGMAAEEAKKAG